MIDKNKYNEFLHILSGCRTILDAYHFAEKYNKNNPDTKNLTTSMINGKKYERNVLDFKTMKSLVEMVDSVEFRDDAEKIINDYSKMTNDKTQLKTLSRISKYKILRNINEEFPVVSLPVVEKNEFPMITKNCPHCKNECTLSSNTEYTICGYTNSKTGYDKVGCGKDWCFKCGKILCKKWETHQLFLFINKRHDGECCKKHAKENNKIYPQDYCNCQNLNVIR